MTGKQQFTLILILGALSTISPFSIDMYLPGFPAIAADLNTTIPVVQLSLTSYFIGIAAGQLLYGPLLDRFGRKRPLYAGLSLYILATLGCALIHSADALIVMRFLQAVGGCAGMVAAQALVRDLFPLEKTAQAFSWITLVIAVSPMIAPAVGGYVTVAFGWPSIFYILAALTGAILIGIYAVLPEGKGPDATLSLLPRPVISNFLTVVKQRQFLLYTLAGGIATAAPFAYIAGSSDVFINRYGVSEQEYGLIFSFIAFFIIGSTQLNHFFLRKFRSAQPAIFEDLIHSITAVKGHSRDVGARCFQFANHIFHARHNTVVGIIPEKVLGNANAHPFQAVQRAAIGHVVGQDGVNRFVGKGQVGDCACQQAVAVQ